NGAVKEGAWRRADIKLAAGEVEEGVALAKAHASSNPGEPGAASILGLALWASGDRAGALREFVRAKELRPDHNEFTALLTWTLRSLESGRDEADAELRSALAGKWDSDSAWIQLVGSYLLGDATAEELEEAHDEKQWLARGHRYEMEFYGAMKHLVEGDQVKARAGLQRCIDSNIWWFVENHIARAEHKRLAD
ncbi:MAG TPA: hypothetical protein VF614_16235, partial [Chthoniobacteraceae bacterium]